MKRIKSFNNTYPVLYLIATPIGNLGEFSPRAFEVINQMDLIAAEDTRNALDLLHKFNIKKPCISLREHNEVEASQNLIKEIKAGKKVAYMSNAGYPGISDPGYLLVKLCLENDIDLVIELPTLYATQSADMFAYGAINILRNLKIDTLVFGTECDNIEDLITMAKVSINNKQYDTLVKNYFVIGASLS